MATGILGKGDQPNDMLGLNSRVFEVRFDESITLKEDYVSWSNLVHKPMRIWDL